MYKNSLLPLFTLLITLILLQPIYTIQWYQQGNPLFMTDQNSPQLLKAPRTYKFLKFFTPWCIYCKWVKPTVQTLKHQLQGNRGDIIFYQINCHQSQNLCLRLGAYSFPTIIMIDENGNPKQKIVGMQPYPVLKDFIRRNTEPQFKKQEIKIPEIILTPNIPDQVQKIIPQVQKLNKVEVEMVQEIKKVEIVAQTPKVIQKVENKIIVQKVQQKKIQIKIKEEPIIKQVPKQKIIKIVQSEKVIEAKKEDIKQNKNIQEKVVNEQRRESIVKIHEKSFLQQHNEALKIFFYIGIGIVVGYLLHGLMNSNNEKQPESPI